MGRTVREALRWTAGIVAAVGPVLFIALTVVLGALWPGYDPVRDTMSELGAVDAPHRLVMNVAGFMGLGVSILAFALAYALTFRAGWPAAAAVAFLVVAGLGMVIVGFYPCDAGCVDVTATGRLRSVFSAPGAIGLPTAAMVSSWVFHRDGRLGRVWQLTSIALGALTLASGPVVAAGLGPVAAVVCGCDLRAPEAERPGNVVAVALQQWHHRPHDGPERVHVREQRRRLRDH